MPKSKSSYIAYDAVPVLLEWCDATVSVEVMPSVKFFRGGAFQLDNEMYRRHRAVSLTNPIRVFRKAGSDLLRIRSAGEFPKELLYYYSYRFLQGKCWTQLVRRVL